MGNRHAYRAFAKMPALALLLAGAHLGCAGNAQTDSSGDPRTEKTVTSEQALLSAGADHETCDEETDGGSMADPSTDPPADPSPSDCGSTSTAACRVRTTASFRTFNSLQAAINASFNGAVITVNGHCAGATVSRRTNLTIQGPFPTFSCATGPAPSGRGALTATVDGLSVQNSTNILVRFLNLVNSVDGVAFVNTTNPNATCVCAANNSNDGVRMTGGTTGIFTQILSERNATGIESNGTNTVIITDNSVTANTGTGIFVRNASSQNVSFNVVTNNGGPGILFQNVTASLAFGNTIRGNGDGLRNTIACINSRNNFGNDVPRSCM
jgi:parallel beta-helix repeat protein